MEIITSENNKYIKNISKLLEKKYRDIENKFLIYGTNIIKEAYESGNLIEIFKCPEYDEINLDVKTTLVKFNVLKKLTNAKNPQKIVGICKKIEPKSYGNKLLVLDDIQDPGNLGTIIRSCIAFGIKDIILSRNTVDLYNEKVIRATEGMIFKINPIKTDLKPFLTKLKEDNYKIIGTSVVDGSNINTLNKENKMALIVGNEGKGLNQEIKKLCDNFIYIPIKEECESLNVGVATSIILYELNKEANCE